MSESTVKLLPVPVARTDDERSSVCSAGSVETSSEAAAQPARSEEARRAKASESFMGCGYLHPKYLHAMCFSETEAARVETARKHLASHAETNRVDPRPRVALGAGRAPPE